MILLLVLPVSLTLWQCFLFPCVFSSITFVVESLATNFVLPNKVQKSRSFSVALMRLREYLRAGANPIKLFCFLPRANLALSYTHRYLIELDCSTWQFKSAKLKDKKYKYTKLLNTISKKEEIDASSSWHRFSDGRLFIYVPYSRKTDHDIKVKFWNLKEVFKWWSENRT